MNASPKEIIKKLKKARKLLQDRGEEGLEILRDPKSEFTWKDTYIFIIDVEKSLVLSNPVFKEREGGNVREHLDWAGEHYGINLCNLANKGGGWLEFTWAKPNDDKPYRKISYIYPIPGYRYTICAGIYNDDLSIDELNSKYYM